MESILTDVRYALAQLRGANVGPFAMSGADRTSDRVRRAIDALERIEAEAVNSIEEDKLNADARARARTSFGIES